MSDRNLRIQLLFQAMDRVTKPLRDIAGGATRTGQNLRAMRDRLREIDAAQADIGSFRQLKAGVRSLETDMQGAQGRVAELARQMAAAENPTKKLATEFARAKREASALKAEHSQESAKLQQLRDRMTAAGISTSRLADHERELRTEAARTNQELTEQARRLKAVQDRSARFAAGRENFGRVQGAAAGLAAGGASAIGTGVAMGAPILGSIGAAMQYESVMTDVAQKASLSREEAQKMGIGLIAAAKAANQLPESLQQGMDALSGLGMDPRQAAKMMAPLGRTATAYKAEMQDLAAAGFAATDNLKVPVEQIGHVLDVMAYADNSGAFAMKDMAQYFPMLTAGYQALNQKGVPAVADLAAALQIARKGTGDSASAATNLANLIQKMVSPDTIKNFKKFGVDLPAALKKAYADGKTPIEAITELTNKALNGDLSRLGFLFGDAQVQQALRPLIQNIDEYRRIRDEGGNSQGLVDAAFAERMRDGAEKAKQFRINAQALGLSLGSTLLPAVNSLMEKGAALANRLGAWADRHPVLAKWIGLTAAGLAALLVVLGGAAIALAGVLAPFAALSFAAGALGIGLLPVIGIAAAVAAGIAVLGAAAYVIYQNWDGIAAWFKSLWERVKTAFDGGLWGIIGLIWEWGGALLSAIGSGLSAAANYLGSVGPGLLSGAWSLIKYALWNGLMLLPRLFFQFGQNTVRGFINGIGSMLGALKSTVVNAASSAANWFKNKLGIRSPSRVFMSLGGFVMDGLTHGIAGGEDAPIARLDGLAKRMATAMAIGAATPAVAAPALTSPSSAGAPVSAASAPAPITIHVYGAPGQSPQDLARAVRAELEKVEREKRARGNSSYADAPDWSDR